MGKICPVCRKELGRHDHYRRHLATHSNERPYFCDICDKGFTRADTLTRHLKKLHSNEPGDSDMVGVEDSPEPSLYSMSGTPVQSLPNPMPGIESYDHHLSRNSFIAPPPLDEENDLAIFGADLLEKITLDFDTVPSFSNQLDQFSWQSLEPELGLSQFGVSTSSNSNNYPTPTSSSAPKAVLPGVQLVTDCWTEYETIRTSWPSIDDNTAAASFLEASRPVEDARLRSVDSDPLPPKTTAWLDKAQAAFFDACRNHRAVLHEPTFNWRHHAPFLRLAICASGARTFGTAEGDDFASKVFSYLGILLQSRWDETSPFQLDSIICALLTQKHLFLSGQPQMLARAYVLGGLILAGSRRSGLVCRKPPGDDDLEASDPPIHDPAKLDHAWRKWAAAHSLSRLTAVILQMENAIGGLLPVPYNPPAFPLKALRGSFPLVSNEAFEAPDANTWAQICLKQPRPHKMPMCTLIGTLNVPDEVGRPGFLSDWVLCAVMDMLRIHARMRALALLPQLDRQLMLPDHDVLWSLDRVRRHYLSPSQAATKKDEIDVNVMRWHACISFTCSDDEMFQTALGRDGPVRAKEAFSRIGTAWSSTPLGRRTAVHCAQALRLYMQKPFDSRFPFVDTEALPFKCAMGLFIYSLGLADDEAETGKPLFNLLDPIDDLDIIGSAGIDNREMSRSELAHCKPVERFIIDGGPACFVLGLPLSTGDGKVAMLEWAADGILATRVTAVGHSFVRIIQQWAAMARKSHLASQRTSSSFYQDQGGPFSRRSSGYT